MYQKLLAEFFKKGFNRDLGQIISPTAYFHCIQNALNITFVRLTETVGKNGKFEINLTTEKCKEKELSREEPINLSPDDALTTVNIAQIDPASPKSAKSSSKNSDDEKNSSADELQPKCPLCQNEFECTDSLCKHLKQVHTCSDVTIQEAIAPYSKPKLAQIEVKHFSI